MFEQGEKLFKKYENWKKNKKNKWALGDYKFYKYGNTEKLIAPYKKSFRSSKI